MTLAEILEKFYAMDRPVSIESVWEDGWHFAIGHNRNGWPHKYYCDTVAQGTKWLCARFDEMYPEPEGK